jgi:1,2-dihydroxy-3-keto-5-methylthiopentene dioxygenase
MSTCAYLFRESAPDRMLEVVDRAGIQLVLRALGVEHRWLPVPRSVAGLDPEVIGARLAPQIDAITAEFRYTAVESIRMTPEHPDRIAARARHRDEQVHEGDEVRWFVDGGGVFWVRSTGLVVATVCAAGDWFHVPAGTRHWFDMGDRPSFCTVRWSRGPERRRARPTGDPIATRFPSAEALLA